jgi:hypothetical protein
MSRIKLPLNSKRNLSLFLIIFGLFFAGFGAGIPGFILIEQQAFIQNAVYSQATVTRIERHSGAGNDDDSYTVHISFFIDDEVGESSKEIVTVLNYYSSSMRAGQTIDIYYSPNNPRDVRTTESNTFLLLFIVIFAGVGVSVFVRGVLMFKADVREAVLRKRLVADGHSVMAEIIEISERNYSVNGKSPYLIRCKFVDLHNEYEFVNKAYFGSVSRLSTGGQLRVWVDRKDFKRYLIDLD